MTSSPALTQEQLDKALQQLEEGGQNAPLSAGAVTNIRTWLTEARYAAYAADVADHLEKQQWQALDDAFWTIIPFGTGGRRGRMYPIGSNAINDRTIGESAQGLAEYVIQQAPHDEWSCAIAYDTRHNSRRFAELCASIMVAHRFKVYFLDDYRSTPELSFLVRHRQCSCGIMVTASHNPPSDNAVKVYWSSGAQILPPHDRAIIDKVMNVGELKRADFDAAVKSGQVEICTEATDQVYLDAVAEVGFSGPRDLKLIYSPLHGVGAASVIPVLARDGFEQVEVYAEHAQPDGDFPNVPNHVSNPENPAVFDRMIERAQAVEADVILATDPDCDRLGCAAPLTLDPSGPWSTFTGNQLSALLCDFVLEQRGLHGQLHDRLYVVTTLVTTKMVRRIAESYRVRAFDNLLVGFKWICGKMDEEGAEDFAFGTEESHGFLVGRHVRDKDGAVACLLMAELAAAVKSKGKSLHEKLDDLFWQHGYHAERLLNVMMEGSEGMREMQALMERLRTQPPESLGGLPVAAARDYLNHQRRDLDGNIEPLDGPEGNLIILDFAAKGNYVAVRPSGTEAKVKFYLFAFTAAEQLADLETTKQETAAQLDAIEADLRKVALGK